MRSAAPSLRLAVLAAAALAAACAKSPKLAEKGATPSPPAAAPRIELAQPSADAGGVVTVRYRLTDNGSPVTGSAATALGPAWTLAYLATEPVSGLPAWKSLVATGTQTVASLPPAGPGTPALQVLTNVKQPGRESPGTSTGGTTTEVGDGWFTYAYKIALPGTFDRDATVRIGVWLNGATGTRDTAATIDFVPSGAPLSHYELTLDANCNKCHGTLVAHGRRVGVKLCLTCHTWQNADPDTADPAALNAAAAATKATFPNPMEMGRLVHRIHRGLNLPTLYLSANCNITPAPAAPVAPTWGGTAPNFLCNVASLYPTLPPAAPPLATPPALPFRPGRNALGPLGTKFAVIGNSSTELVVGVVGNTYDANTAQTARPTAMGVGFPQDLRNCDACHAGAPDRASNVTSISRRTCAGCHPDAWFGPVAAPTDLDPFHMPHSGGPCTDDGPTGCLSGTAGCVDCHVTDRSGAGGPKLYAPIADIHQAPSRSPHAKTPVFRILSVQGLKPGSPSATITYRIDDAAGVVSPLDIASPAVGWIDLDPVAPSPAPRAMTSLTFRLGGPNTDIMVKGTATEVLAGTSYSRNLAYSIGSTPSALTDARFKTADGSGVFTYTFANPLPIDATGVWTLTMEGRRRSTVSNPPALPWYGWYNPGPASASVGGITVGADAFVWPYTGESVTEAADNVIVAVDLSTGALATDPGATRRRVVSVEKCEVCHLKLSAHGGTRNDPNLCVVCHTPDATDWMYRPRDLRTTGGNGQVLLADPLAAPPVSTQAWTYATADGIEERSINLKTMIHRIHTGERTGAASLEGIEPFVIHSGPSSPSFLSDARFPGDLANCEHCHEPGTWRPEAIPATAAPTVANEAANIRHAAGSLNSKGSLAAAASSADGSSWTLQSFPSADFGGVAWSPGLNLFAAVGAQVAATSPDGAAWTARATPVQTYNAAAWFPNVTTPLFVAVGNAAGASSPDGITWTNRAMTGNHAAVACSATLCVSVGFNVAATTATGTAWTAQTIPAAAIGAYGGIAWSGTTFAAVGANSSAMTSPDGVAWTAQSIPKGNYTAIAWNGTTFVAVGTNVAATSPDGVAWTAQSIPAAPYTGVAWSGAAFVAVGPSKAATSPDGIAWTTRSISSGNYAGVAGSGAVLAAVGNRAAAPKVTTSSAATTQPITSACLTCHTNGAAVDHAATHTADAGGVENCMVCHGASASESVARHHAVP
jgi:OmcA/MtrC family decaheme c-type cytochrome